ncbi:hypothetical protein [Companilactobacillus zhongbaensis]|uniref:hypothetical protein n=1 Tax=Companilactobacillus zhongbaensis TaxID=2486009 RepID=UPI000F77A259|nr:hypothetical protein [Companilactobacillus zhongbaensis]
MDRTRTKNLIKALIELLSFHVFAISFIWTHNLPSSPINYYLLSMVAMVAIYKEFMLPMKPNQFFSILYSAVFLILCIFGFKSMNIFVMILIFAQVCFLFIPKSIPPKYYIISVLIKDFVVPSFISIAILFYYAHFISIKFVVPLLLINITAVMITYFDGEVTSYVQIIAVAIATVVLFLLNYLNIYSSIAIIAYMLITVLLKIFNKFATTNVIYRFVGNLLVVV